MHRYMLIYFFMHLFQHVYPLVCFNISIHLFSIRLSICKHMHLTAYITMHRSYLSPFTPNEPSNRHPHTAKQGKRAGFPAPSPHINSLPYNSSSHRHDSLHHSSPSHRHDFSHRSNLFFLKFLSDVSSRSFFQSFFPKHLSYASPYAAFFAFERKRARKQMATTIPTG